MLLRWTELVGSGSEKQLKSVDTEMPTATGKEEEGGEECPCAICLGSGWLLYLKQLCPLCDGLGASLTDALEASVDESQLATLRLTREGVSVANFCRFHGRDASSVLLSEVAGSSAGIDGWADAVSIAERQVSSAVPIADSQSDPSRSSLGLPPAFDNGRQGGRL